jgi:hypothetical protein
MTDEREKIVAWLRHKADEMEAKAANEAWVAASQLSTAALCFRYEADAIERGDHLVWKPKPTIPVAEWIDKPSAGH